MERVRWEGPVGHPEGDARGEQTWDIATWVGGLSRAYLSFYQSIVPPTAVRVPCLHVPSLGLHPAAQHTEQVGNAERELSVPVIRTQQRCYTSSGDMR